MTAAPAAAGAPAAPQVAYLVTQYPALSHAFIETEVAALRAAGARIDTFTVRPCPPGQLLTDHARQEAERTPALVPAGRARLVAQVAASAAALLRRSPGAWRAGLGAAARSGPPSPRLRLRQLCYLLEAVVLWHAMQRRGLRHLHVHFANNGADVARLVTAIGSAVDGAGSWTWSFTMHGPTELDDVWRHDLPAKVRSAVFVSCISDFARSQLMKLVEPEHWPKLHVVRMGIDPARFSPDGERPGGQHDRGAPVEVLSVGRLVAAKGMPLLVEAVGLLRARGVGGLHVSVVGDGPLRPSLQASIERAGLSGTVTLCGPLGQDVLAQRYRLSDVFCLPSLSEGLPVVLMEAMATGLPVVATAVAATGELVRDGETGVLLPPGRADVLATALARLASDAALREDLGRRGRERVLALHQAPASAAQLLALLAQLPTARAAEQAGQGLP